MLQRHHSQERLPAVAAPPFRARDLFGRVRQHQANASAFFANATVELLAPGHVKISSSKGSLTNALIQGITTPFAQQRPTIAKKGDSLEIIYRENDEKLLLAADWLPNNGFFNVNFAPTLGA